MLADGRVAELGPVLQQARQLGADLGAIRLVEAMALAETGREAEGRVIYQRVAPRLKQLNMLREGLLRRAGKTFVKRLLKQGPTVSRLPG